MVDFLKANPFVSMEQYRWELSVPMIRLMSVDNTRIHYLTEKQAQNRKSKVYDGKNGEMLSDLGIPIFSSIENN